MAEILDELFNFFRQQKKVSLLNSYKNKASIHRSHLSMTPEKAIKTRQVSCPTLLLKTFS